MKEQKAEAKLQAQEKQKNIQELEKAMELKNKQLGDMQRDKAAEVNLLTARVNTLVSEKEAVQKESGLSENEKAA